MKRSGNVLRPSPSSATQATPPIQHNEEKKMRARLLGVATAMGVAAVPLQGVFAQTPPAPTPTPASTPAAPAAADCTTNPDPYKNYACLDN